MSVIILLEEEAEKAGVIVEAAIELSRVMQAEICCLDRLAGQCAAPVALALRDEPALPKQAAGNLCDICLIRRADECDAILATATFILSRSVPLLRRTLQRGYGPVLLLPPAKPRFLAAGRAMIAWDGSPSIRRLTELCLPLLRCASHVELVSAVSPWSADEDGAAFLARHAIPASHVDIHGRVSLDTPIHALSGARGYDWCLIGGGQALGAQGDDLARLIANSPCPLLIGC
jgi:hypothetical protein